MSEPDYKLRNDNADTKLEDAKEHLEHATATGALTHPASVHVAEALRHIREAQSYLRGA